MATLDLLVRGGLVIDGSGRAGRVQDVGVQGGEIVAVGDLAQAEAAETVDASGLVVTPGFIDMHSHSDLSILRHPDATSRIVQGITTEVVGNCGHSAAPRADGGAAVEGLDRDLVPDGVRPWWSLAEFAERVAAARPATNQALLVGHGTVRRAVMGYAAMRASAAETTAMCDLVTAAMEDGAFGLSSGLIYAPGAYAGTDEVVALARAAAAAGGRFYATHMRDEADGLFEALDEALEIGRRADLPVQVSHLKAAGVRQHGRIGEAIARIEAARTAGFDVQADFYPYEAGSTGLGALLPPWLLEGGPARMVERLGRADVRRQVADEIERGLPGWWNPVGAMGGDWDRVLVTRVAADGGRSAQGRRIGEIARERGVSPLDAVAELLAEAGGSVQIVIFMMTAEDVRTVAGTAWVSMGTDGSAISPAVADRQLVHPRTYGTTARFLADHAGVHRPTAWEEAVRRMTAMPAERLGLANRGRVAPGMRADLVVLDRAHVEDRATYARPHVAPAGVELVTVNGVVALRAGQVTGARAGEVLRRA